MVSSDGEHVASGRGRLLYEFWWLMSKLKKFLEKNSVRPCNELPAVHTTKAQMLENIVDSRALTPADCNVFIGEKLTYLFYGKPSYKVNATTPKLWLMPVSFLISMSAVPSIKRVYPFDSGAFAARRHPDYLLTFNMNEFEVDGHADPAKIVGAFFDTVTDYFKLNPKDPRAFTSEHSLSIFDAEISALRDLAADSSLKGIDDRRFAVEIQTQDEIDLTSGSVRAVILPYEYFDNEKVINFITEELKAVPLPYESYSLSSSEHTAVVYSKVMEFLRHEGVN